MPHIETSLARFLLRMEGVQAFVSLRSFDGSTSARCFAPRSKPAAPLDLDLSRAVLSGPGWYDSSWDLIQGLVVRESTAAGAGRLDDWSQCLFA
jgi:hypothetical protein